MVEDAASEFDVQGLELDWTCLVWDGDLRRKNDTWQNFSFTGNKWLNISSEERKAYQINAYRVLLTRVRQGMVMVILKTPPVNRSFTTVLMNTSNKSVWRKFK